MSERSGLVLLEISSLLMCASVELQEFAVETQEMAGGWKTHQTGCETATLLH